MGLPFPSNYEGPADYPPDKGEMQAPTTSTQLQSMAWIDVGEPPAAVLAWRAARLKKAQSFGGLLIGVLIGGLAGFLVVARWPGAQSWSWATEVALFLAAAVPVGVAEFFVNRWMLARTARRNLLHVRRMAIVAGQLHLDQVSGAPVERPLKQVHISKDAIAGGWYVVSLLAGRTALVFFVPPLAASTLTSAMNR